MYTVQCRGRFDKIILLVRSERATEPELPPVDPIQHACHVHQPLRSRIETLPGCQAHRPIDAGAPAPYSSAGKSPCRFTSPRMRFTLLFNWRRAASKALRMATIGSALG